MDKLKELLQKKYPDIDFDKEKHLVDDGILDSVEVVSIISEVEIAFDIAIPMEYIHPSYFQSIESIWEMIEELM